MAGAPDSLDPAQLLHSPRLMLAELDLPRGQARLVPMDEDGYRASSFLDGRAQRAEPRDALVPLSALVQLVRRGVPQPRPAHYLFHTGHCGSTLLSRLLGELPGLFALREPPPLLLVAQIRRHLGRPGMAVSAAQCDLLAQCVDALLARTWHPAQRALIKPTSHANNLIRPLLAAHRDNRGVLLHLDFEAHLAVMLRERNQPESAQALRDARWLDWCRLTGAEITPPPALDAGERAALLWLVQMHEMHAALADPGLGARLRALHFHDYLAEPAGQLGALARWYGVEADPDRVAGIASGPIAGRDAKDPARAHVAAETHASATPAQADAFARGRAWLQAQLEQHPVLRPVWERFGSRAR